MILFTLLLVVIFVISVNSGMRLAGQQKRLQSDTKAAIVIQDVPKFCPPHKWFYQEVKDLEGKTVKWKMVCEICGPLKPSTGSTRME